MTRLELERGLPGSGGAAVLAYFPASAKGGGALNFGRGDGVRSGDAGGDSRRLKVDDVCCASGRGLLAGGRAGGGPLFEAVVLPVFWGLIDCILPGGADGGGGGGNLLRRSLIASSGTSPAFNSAVEFAFFDSMYCLMKSEFCSI